MRDDAVRVEAVAPLAVAAHVAPRGVAVEVALGGKVHSRPSATNTGAPYPVGGKAEERAQGGKQGDLQSVGHFEGVRIQWAAHLPVSQMLSNVV